MNKEIKEKWIAALESDEYRQTQGYLKDRGGFCCLGVLCDLYSKETDTPWQIEDGLCVMGGSSGVLPTEVMEWSNIPNAWGDHQNKEYVIQSLTAYNDNGKNFKEIAEIIREYF